MKAMVRVNALTLGGSGDKSLSTMQRHGKRLDATSQKRKVRDVPPLVYGSLDLLDAYQQHVKGCNMNVSLKKPVLHALVKFPTEFPITAKNEAAMLSYAVEFINQTHGGNAVFAARLDRDEAGQHTVDVFFSPKYTKQTKNRKKETIETEWISTTKFGKEMCNKHRLEIMSRNEQGKFTTTPRSNGIALQTELDLYFASKKIKLEPRKIKKTYGNDRLESEAYKEIRDFENQVNARLDAAEAAFDAGTAQLAVDRKDFESEKTAFMRLSERMSSAVSWLCERFGIVAPSDIHERMAALEGEVERMKAEDLSTEDPTEEASGPNF